MNKLTYTCGDDLGHIDAYSCTPDFGNRIDVIFFGKDGASYGFSGVTGATSGIAPSVAELQALMGTGSTGDTKIVAIRHITNGIKEKISSDEESGIDTETGGSREYNVIYGISGRVKALNNNVIEKFHELGELEIARIWPVTNKGYVMGGLTGYKVSTKGKISLPLMDGSVPSPWMEFSFQFNGDGALDNMVQDDDYLTIDNT